MNRCLLPPISEPGLAHAVPVLRYVKMSDVPCRPSYLLIGDNTLANNELYYAYSIIESAKNDDWFTVFQQYGVASCDYGGYIANGVNYSEYADCYDRLIAPNLADNVLVIFLTGHSFAQDGQGSSWCAWHACDDAGRAFAFVPSPTIDGCIGGLTFLQRLGILLTHELGEMLTHPNPDGQHGWVDAGNASEGGDDCAWSLYQFQSGLYGQRYWSNRLGRCYPL